ncbi:DEAD/DEAH box helicase family protein [Mycoplasma sp. 246B]
MEKFNNELEFEKSLIQKLKNYGWNNEKIQNSNIKDTLENISTKDLEENWRNILFEINKATLKNVPLDNDEFDELKNIIFKSSYKIKDFFAFLQGETVSIKRTNPELSEEDKKESVNLKIFSNKEIRGGDTIYQTARQINIEGVRKRIDVLLLINGLPLFCLELKQIASGIQDAKHQLINYGKAGVFNTGVLNFVQVIVAMTENNMEYAARVDDFYEFDINSFRYWKNHNNQIVHQLDEIISLFFKIPEAHNLISNGTIIKDNKLFITRNYQFYAIRSILDQIEKIKSIKDNKCGFIWHTTGSGKTLTSFQTARVLLKRKIVSTVIFVVDRMDLHKQSFDEFWKFKKSDEDKIEVKKALSILDLERKLKKISQKSNMFATIIITSIQKLSKITKNYFSDKDKIALIFDEAHRSVYGEMIAKIQEVFTNGIFIGFTGTPIQDVNQKNDLTTEQVFGKQLHQYTIKDGLEDGNVLRFYNHYIDFKQKYLPMFFYNCVVANKNNPNKKFSANEIELLIENKEISAKDVKIWNLIKHKGNLQNKDDTLTIEEWLKDKGYYDNKYFKMLVAHDILKNWNSTSGNRKYSAILATKSIKDAIEYFKIFQKLKKKYDNYVEKFKVTALFDPNLDSSEQVYGQNNNEIIKKFAIKFIQEPKNYIYEFKELINAVAKTKYTDKELEKMNDELNSKYQENNWNDPKDISDYIKNKLNFNSDKEKALNEIYQKFEQDYKNNNLVQTSNLKDNFKIVVSDIFKKRDPNKKVVLDLLIVVNQMLTGYDSKYINTVFFDKIQENEQLIQSMSRTNRLDNNDKPFGSIYFYRQPEIMKINLENALKIYSGVKEEDISYDKEDVLLEAVKKDYAHIFGIFSQWNEPTFAQVPFFDLKNPDETLRTQLRSFIKHYAQMRKNITALSILRVDVYDKLKGIINKNNIDKLSLRFKEIDRSVLKSTSINKNEPEDLTLNESDIEWASNANVYEQIIDWKYFDKYFLNHNYKKQNEYDKYLKNEESKFNETLAYLDPETKGIILKIKNMFDSGLLNTEIIKLQGTEGLANSIKSKEIRDKKQAFKDTYHISKDTKIETTFDELWDLEESRWSENGRLGKIYEHIKKIDSPEFEKYIKNKQGNFRVYNIQAQFREDLKNKKIG